MQLFVARCPQLRACRPGSFRSSRTCQALSSLFTVASEAGQESGPAGAVVGNEQLGGGTGFPKVPCDSEEPQCLVLGATSQGAAWIKARLLWAGTEQVRSWRSRSAGCADRILPAGVPLRLWLEGAAGSVSGGKCRPCRLAGTIQMCSQESTTLPLELSPSVFTAAACLASGFVTGRARGGATGECEGFPARSPLLPQRGISGSWAGPGRRVHSSSGRISAEGGKGPDLWASRFDSPGGRCSLLGRVGDLTSEQHCT